MVEKKVTTKAVKTLSKYAFKELGLKTLQIIVHKDNTPSNKKEKKCHFKWQKTLIKSFTPTGKTAIDMELYELYNED